MAYSIIHCYRLPILTVGNFTKLPLLPYLISHVCLLVMTHMTIASILVYIDLTFIVWRKVWHARGITLSERVLKRVLMINAAWNSPDICRNTQGISLLQLL